jgi:HEPN domain-containing protein
MNNEEAQEWLEVADNDFHAVNILNKDVRKPREIICYHCAQAVEKYLKGFLVYHDIIPKKTHDLVLLNDICFEIDNDFQNIYDECRFLYRFAIDIRYPNKNEVTDGDLIFAIAAVEKVRDFKPISDMRTSVT